MKKKNKTKTASKVKKGKQEDVEMSEDNKECMEMDISSEATAPKLKTSARKGGSYGNRRKPVLDLDCFVKDLKESLPK